MSFWKSIIPDITVSSLVDMTHEELSLIDALINNGDVDTGSRVLDNVLNPNHSTVAVVMINSSIAVTAPKPAVPISSSYYRRRRALSSNNDQTFQIVAADFNADNTTFMEIAVTSLLAFLCVCQIIR